MKQHLYEKNVRKFLAKIDTSGGEDACHPWTGILFPNGYGEWSVAQRTISSHRMIWTVYNGPITGGLQVLHRCDNKACCNVKHLFLGTQHENMLDKKAKGRQARYQRCGRAVCGLKDGEIWLIRRLVESGVSSNNQIGRMFRRSGTAISRIRNGQSYSWVENEP